MHAHAHTRTCTQVHTCTHTCVHAHESKQEHNLVCSHSGVAAQPHCPSRSQNMDGVPQPHSPLRTSDLWILTPGSGHRPSTAQPWGLIGHDLSRKFDRKAITQIHIIGPWLYHMPDRFTMSNTADTSQHQSPVGNRLLPPAVTQTSSTGSWSLRDPLQTHSYHTH